MAALLLPCQACTSPVTDGLGPQPPAQLRIVPDSATVTVGDTLRFSATAAGAPVPVGWSATGGAIDSGGLFHATVTGEFLVIATQAGGLRDSATIRVRDVSTTPPSTALVGECDHPGSAWVWCDDFEQDRLARYFEYDDANGRFVRLQGAGAGGSTGMRATYVTSAQTSSGSLHLALGRTPQPFFRPVDAGTTDHRELYWRVYVRYPLDWQGGGADKLSRATSFVSATSWAQSMIAHVWSGQGLPYEQHLYIDPASGTDEAGTVRTTEYNDFPNLRWLGAAQGATPVFADSARGRWHCIEAHARLNDPGRSNGLFELWVDGRRDAVRDGLNWVGSYTGYGLNAVFVENYWNAGAPVGQFRDLDNFVVSTAPIGCPA